MGPGPWAAALVGLTLILRLPVFLYPFFNGDEATYTALANALLDGHTLYVGAVDHKPPMLALTYAAIYAGVGRYAIHWVHAISIVVVAATGLLIGAVGRSGGVTRLEARVASLAFVVFFSIGPGRDVLAADGELFMLLPSVAAVGLVARDQMGHARAQAPRYLLAGILAAVASLYKYQAAAILIPLVVLACRGVPIGRAAARLLGLAVGVLCPLAALVLWYGGAGQLEALRFWAWTYPLQYAGALGGRDILHNFIRTSLEWAVAWCALIGGAAIAWSSWRSHLSRRPLMVVAAWWVAGAAAGVSAGGRFFFHYYLQMLPPLCLLASPVLAGTRRVSPLVRRTLLVMTATPLLVYSSMNVLNDRVRPQFALHTNVYLEVARFFRAHSPTTDTLFVWGNSPEIYFFAERPMGTRFPFCNYHSGKIWGTPADVPGAEAAPSQVSEPAWDMLLEDLGTRKPAWIVDAAAGQLDRWAGHQIPRYPRLAAVVQRDYQWSATVAGVTIYRRSAR